MHQHRRRKKHPSYGMRTIEICRSQIGFGFTISGQAPCMLSCIVNSSPAEKAGLKPGEYVIAVNGQNVSKALHDDVVRLIGNSTGVLKLQIAENYYSDSSDEEVITVNRPKLKHSTKTGNKNNLILSNKSLKRAEKVVQDLQAGLLFQRQYFNDEFQPHFPTTSPQLLSNENEIENIFQNAQTNELSSQKNIGLCENQQITGKNYLQVLPKPNLICKSKWNCSGVKSNLGNCLTPSFKENFKSCSCEQELPNYVYFSLHYMHTPWSAVIKNAAYKSVIGYLGTIEMPKENDLHLSRLQIIRNCIRRLRIERKVHTLVLFTVFADKIVLINPRGLLIATYPADKIIFSGIYADDRKFFGLVTSQGIEISETVHNKDLFSNSSCHVFMIDSKLAKHETHVNVAKMFGIKCEGSDSRQCGNFPDSAEPVLHAMSSFYDSGDHDLSPVLANIDLTDTDQSNNASGNSSNSDSGIGFRDDCNADHVFVVDVTNPQHHSVFPETFSNLTEEKNIAPVGNEISNVPTHVPPVKTNETTDSVRLTVRAMPNPIGYNKSTVVTSSKKDSYSYESNRNQNSLNKAFIWTGNPVPNYKTNSLKVQDAKQTGNLMSSSEISNQFYDTVPILHKLNSSNHKKLPVKYEEDLIQSTPLINHSGKLSKSCEEKMPAKTENENQIFNHLGENEEKEKTELIKSSAMDKKIGADNASSVGNVKLLPPSDKGSRLRSNSACSLDNAGTLGGVAQWAISFEKLLEDPLGLHTFAEFMKKQFCHENIYFWIACERFRKFAGPQEMKAKAKEIFQRHLSSDAWEPINVDSLARQVAQEGLENPTKDLFRAAQQQIYNLMKYDCYARFLKSSLYKENLLKEMAGETLMFDTDEKLNPDLPYSSEVKEKSKKEGLTESFEESRRKSLLPWNRVKLSKNKENSKGFLVKSSEFRKSFTRKTKKGQQTASPNTSHTSNGTNDIIKLHSNSGNKDLHFLSMETTAGGSGQQVNILCRVILPDRSSTVIQTKPQLSIYSLLYSLLEKRGHHYSAIDIFLGHMDKPINPLDDSSSLECQEIRVEERVIFQLKLPNKKNIAVKGIPSKTLQDVLHPILQYYGYKLEYIKLEQVGNKKIVNLADSLAKFNNYHFIIKSVDTAVAGGHEFLDVTKKTKTTETTDKSPYTILCNTSILKGEIVAKFDSLGILELKSPEEETENTNNENKISLVRRNSIHLGNDVSKQIKSKFQQAGRSSIHESRGVFHHPSRRISLLPKTRENSSNEEHENWKYFRYDQLEDETNCEINCEMPDFLKTKPVYNPENHSRISVTHNSKDSTKYTDISNSETKKTETFPLNIHPLSVRQEISNKTYGNVKEEILQSTQRQSAASNHIPSVKSKMNSGGEAVFMNQVSSYQETAVKNNYDRRLSYPIQTHNPTKQIQARTTKSVFSEHGYGLPSNNIVTDRKEFFEKQKRSSHSLQYHPFANKSLPTEGQKPQRETNNTSSFLPVHSKLPPSGKVLPDNLQSSSFPNNPISSSQSTRIQDCVDKDLLKEDEKISKAESSSRFYSSVNRMKNILMNQKEQQQKFVNSNQNEKKQLNISFV